MDTLGKQSVLKRGSAGSSWRAAMPQNTLIRKASETDAGAIRDVINTAFSSAELFFVNGDRITLAEVEEGLGRGAFLLAELDGAVEGCVYVEPRGERAYLGLLSVHPKQQQKGLGSRLVQAGEDYCGELSCRFMDIKIVNLRTELPDFYRKRGYVETGTSPFPSEVETKLPCHFIDMTKPL